MRGVTPGVVVAILMATTMSAVPADASDGRCGSRNGGNRIEIVGLTDDQSLICFAENNPSQTDSIGAVRGLTGDTRLVGIDFRPAGGELYGLGNDGGIYTLDLRSGAATFRSKLSVALSGGSFDIDFNPTVDRLRIVSDTGQNLRVNVDTGAATTDTNLAYPDAGAAATGITGVAYTNNDANANTGTTLYGIDTRQDQLVIQAPPNAGGLNATGKLLADAGADVGFDIYSRINGGTTVDVLAFASLVVDGRSRLYRINLFTGRATAARAFRSQQQVVDIAIPLGQ